MIFVAQTQSGDHVQYRDTKRYLWILSTLTPLVPAIAALALAISGNLLFAPAALVFYFIVIPIFDMLVGEDRSNPPDEVVEQMAEDQYYRRLLFIATAALWLNAVIVTAVLATVALPLWAVLLVVIGAGVASGSGLTVSHELGHKFNFWDKTAAKMINGLMGYGHFSIEHNRGHHVSVATPDDASSSRLGESIYGFAKRELPTVLARGIELERKRLEKKGLRFWHWNNDLLHAYAITAFTGAIVIAIFGFVAVPFLLLHHFVAWLQLTQANYVEHYGLLRKRLPNGRLEPCQPHHSWNTNHIVSNLFLFHLQRHSDHHANPIRPYQALRNFEDLPHLPSGYPGSFVLAALPPLWFAIMDRKVCKWAGGDVKNCNVRPGYEAYYAAQFSSFTKAAQ